MIAEKQNMAEKTYSILKSTIQYYYKTAAKYTAAKIVQYGVINLQLKQRISRQTFS